MLVCCILLNRTTGRQVRRVVWNLFDRYPSPDKMASARTSTLSSLIKSLGFSNKRTELLKSMSSRYKEGFDDPYSLPGVGAYAKASWDIFVEGRKDVVTNDGKLAPYLEWLKTTGGEPRGHSEYTRAAEAATRKNGQPNG